MSEKFVCDYCKKEYTTISNLRYHQKNTKACLDIQAEVIKDFKCEYCNKVFSNNKYLKQHLQKYCKSNKVQQENEILKNKIEEMKTKFEKLEKEYKSKLDKIEIEMKSKIDKLGIEMKFKLENKDEIIKIKDNNINKLQKEINDYKKLATRPTNVYNTNNTNNYQIQYNQLVDQIETLNKENISKRISSIEIEDITKYGIKNFENTVSNSLSNVFKDFTFCTDKARKTVVIKKDNNETEKVSMDEFIQIGLTLGIKDILTIIDKIETFNDYNIDDYDREEFSSYDESLQKIKDYLKMNKVNINDKDYPLPSLMKNTLTNVKHLTKVVT
jgi:hypothetical protein